MQDAQVQRAATEGVRAPQFSKSHPKLWLVRLQSHFHALAIDDVTKYHAIVSALDGETEILNHVSDILLNPPAQDMYKTLLNRLEVLFADSELTNLKRRLTDLVLGTKRPTQLLLEMRELSVGKLDDDSLKPLWLDRLPTQIQSILCLSDDNLNKLAGMADKLIEYSPSADCPNTELEELRADIEQLSKRIDRLEESRSRSRSNLINPSKIEKDKERPKVNLNLEGSSSSSRRDHRRTGTAMKRSPALAKGASAYRSIKKRSFPSEPCGKKPVSDIPGIGIRMAYKLKANGITQAMQIVGQYMILSGDEDKFIEYIADKAGATEKNAYEAFIACRDYCENHV